MDTHEHGHALTHLCRVVHDVNASCLESLDLVKSTALSSRDDSASVAHSATWRSSLASNKGKNREFSCIVSLEPVCSFLLSLTANLTNHNNTVCLGIFYEALKDINEVGAVEWISTNADDG